MKKAPLILALILALVCILPASAAAYSIGDEIADFSVTTPAGEVITLSGLLENHKAVLINFWFINCSWCDYEFPFLQQAYEEMGNEVAVLALTPYDKSEDIAAYQQEKGLTFPMAEDTANLSTLFGCTGFPTTVMIDRYGVYCFSESGAMPSKNAFLRLMQPFAADDYAQSLTYFVIPAAQPAQTMPAPDKMAAALNAPDTDIVYSAVEGAWPWLLQDNTYAFSSNS
ncbi:MAG: TlpA family protein disulfide reductase, partial [Clostridia bacterium]|nr:TlpA family protein disulfide reductase [Clostridia bacterium]